MPKPSTREAILREGLRVCLACGYTAASVRDITRAAGAPLGSFINHFASKEAFAMELLELYREIWRKRFATTLLDESIAPREAFERFFSGLRKDQENYQWKTGCLLGHFSLEAGALSEEFRGKLSQAHAERKAGFAAALRRAVVSGDAQPGIDCDGAGEFLDEALQGATMKVRVEESPAPFDRFHQHVFQTFLTGGQLTKRKSAQSKKATAH